MIFASESLQSSDALHCLYKAPHSNQAAKSLAGSHFKKCLKPLKPGVNLHVICPTAAGVLVMGLARADMQIANLLWVY